MYMSINCHLLTPAAYEVSAARESISAAEKMQQYFRDRASIFHAFFKSGLYDYFLYNNLLIILHKKVSRQNFRKIKFM